MLQAPGALEQARPRSAACEMKGVTTTLAGRTPAANGKELGAAERPRWRAPGARRGDVRFGSVPFAGKVLLLPIPRFGFGLGRNANNCFLLRFQTQKSIPGGRAALPFRDGYFCLLAEAWEGCS